MTERKGNAAALERVNGRRLVGATASQNVGDQLSNASTVLPWLFTALGAPAALVGLLVPIRESGSMLPQAALTSWVVSRRRRALVCALGAVGQGAMLLVMALFAAFARGVVAGVGILVALAVFAFFRSLASMGSKDVQGRTISKGRRGRITGTATALGGLVAITVGLGIRMWGGESSSGPLLMTMLVVGAVFFGLAAWFFARIQEPPDESISTVESSSAGEPSNAGNPENPAKSEHNDWLADSWELVTTDARFRWFVIVRALLLVSALAPPFIVSLAAERGNGELGGLGPFIIASGLAALIGGRAFGRLADRSSRKLMITGAAAASVIIIAMIVLISVPGFGHIDWSEGLPGLLFPVTYFLLTFVHTGVRVGRKTYVVDIAEGDERTRYVAVSNTIMGVLLLVAGGISAGLAAIGSVWALGFLAALGVVGALAGSKLEEAEEVSSPAA